MIRIACAFLILSLSAFSTSAEQSLSPQEIESLPFNMTGAATPKTEALIETIDTMDEIDTAQSESAGLPQFNTDTFASQLFWLFVSFGILYIFFAKTALPRLSSVMEDRMMTVRGDLEQAEMMGRDAEETKKAYEQAITNAHNEAHAYILEVTEALRQDAANEAEAFKNKSNAEIENLETQADKAINAIKSDLADTVAEITSDIVEKLTDLKVKQADINKTVSKLMDHKQVA